MNFENRKRFLDFDRNDKQAANARRVIFENQGAAVSRPPFIKIGGLEAPAP
jgi:hypothetical protein